MRAVKELFSAKLLTEQQFLAAHRFARRPHAFSFPPSIMRVLMDFCVHGLGIEEVETSRGWAQRSARMILSVLLNGVIETPENAEIEPLEDTLQAGIDMLRGTNARSVAEAMRSMKLTAYEAQLFLILQACSPNPLSVEAIYFRIYSNENDGPDASVITVRITQMRQKLKQHGWMLKNFYGVGYALMKSPAPVWTSADIEIYLKHMVDGSPLSEVADMFKKTVFEAATAVHVINAAMADPIQKADITHALETTLNDREQISGTAR